MHGLFLQLSPAMDNPRRSRSWSLFSAVIHVHPRRARATSAPPQRTQRVPPCDVSVLYALALPAGSDEDRAIVERCVDLIIAQQLPQDWDDWKSRCEAILATVAWGRAAASTAAARRALAEREPTAEELIIGSGWLSHELPNYPRLDTWGRLPYPEDDMPEVVGTEDNGRATWTWGQQSTLDNEDPSAAELTGWREEFIDYCEVVRACAARRASIGFPAVPCSRYSPCNLCRYHPGANLPCGPYWRSFPQSEIDARIADRETERSLRDETIRRRERATIHDWNWDRRTASRSRSPTVREGAISVRCGPHGPSSRDAPAPVRRYSGCCQPSSHMCTQGRRAYGAGGGEYGRTRVVVVT